MSAKQTLPGSSAGDTYDLAAGLRRRLAEAARPQPTSVESQLQSAVRERLGSDHPLVRDRFRRRSRRGIDHE